MSACQGRRALISVYDKTGIVDFARALHEDFGVEIITTGGTAKTLKNAGIPVTPVEQITGFPEMMDGRVKTLHPRIHAAILADRDNPAHMRELSEHGIEPIDLVVVNLYPFEDTIAGQDCRFEEAIEMIDIGGPCLLRAAAKNHKHVRVVTSPSEYQSVLEELRAATPERRARACRLGACAAFETTCHYDSKVATWLRSTVAGTEQIRMLELRRRAGLRYGENPHQQADLWEPREESSTFPLSPLGESTVALSFNNYVDASAALNLCSELTRAAGHGFATPHPRPRVSRKHACCFIKHTNACGAATDADPIEAYRKAYLGDPNAAMGGILAVDFDTDRAFAEAVMETYQRWGKRAGAGGFFVEVWLAPTFDDDAVELIRTSKGWGQRARLLAVGERGFERSPSDMDIKRICGGMLWQTPDLVGLNEDQWKVVTDRQPSAAEMRDLRLAWLVCKHTKSNAITICKDGMLIGNGAGQMSRIMSCRIASWLAEENNHGDELAGAVAASDGFFPFRDGPDILADAGVAAIIQPGGSKRDEEVIAACNERGVAMIITGTRHFKH